MREDTEQLSSSSAVLDSPPTLWTGPVASDPAGASPFPVVPGYEILSELGRGGMGVVYRARQRALDRVVALKMLLIGPRADLAALTRFWVETQTVAKLHHRNIVQVHDSGSHRDLPYCALELLPGGSLRERMVGEPWQPRAAAELTRTLARAMHVAHAAGVVHRDLKPANVLFDSEDQPKITDFGVAKDLLNPACGFTMTGEIVGTPAYMAPEQADGARRDVGPAADIYALGVVLYELLAAQVPFKGSDPLDLLMHVRHSEPPSLRARVHGVPVDLEVICLKCLEKDPAKRYASADALADELQRFLDGCPIQARPVGELERVARWCRRNPLVTSTIAVVVSVFLASFLLVTWSYFRAEQALTKEGQQRAEAQASAEDERWQRYRANIVAASSSLQLHNVGATRRLLETAPKEHRNWEWQVLHQQLDVSSFSKNGRLTEDERISSCVEPGGAVSHWDSFTGKVLSFHPKASRPIHRIILSPDGALAAYEGDEGKVVLWSVAENRAVAELGGHVGRVGVMRFRRDGARLVTSSDDHHLRIWDVASGQQLHVLRGHQDSICHACFSPDGAIIASTSSIDKSARLWDAGTGRLLHVLRDDLDGEFAPIEGIAVSPKGDRVVTVNYGYPNTRALLWDAATGKRVAVLDKHQNRVTGFDFSPDGEQLVTCSFDQSVRVWDSRTGAHRLVLLGHTGQVNGAVYSPDGSRILSYSQDRTLRVWDADHGTPLAVLHGHTADITRAAYSPDGASLVSHSDDGTVRRWDADAAERRGVLRQHANYVYGVAFHPDGEHVASCSWDGAARYWRLNGSQCLRVFDHDKAIVASVAIHPNGLWLATLSRDDSIRLWDIATGALRRRWAVKSQTWCDSRIAFSPDGKLLACGDTDNHVLLFDVHRQAEPVHLLGHINQARDVVFSPCGSWLASAGGSGDQSIHVWSVADRRLVRVLQGHSNCVYCLAVNAKGTLLASGSNDGTVRLWDTETWREVASLKHGSNVYGLAFSPDGTRLVSACSDNSIRVWDVQKGEEVAELRGHGSYVHSVAFSPDGSRLVSASGDRTLRLWDARHANERK